MDGYEVLANEIILQAVKDYRKLNPWLEGASKGSSVLTGSMFLLV